VGSAPINSRMRIINRSVRVDILPELRRRMRIWMLFFVSGKVEAASCPERLSGLEVASRFYLLKILAGGRTLLIVRRQVPDCVLPDASGNFLPSSIYGEHHFSRRAMG
jgi:hypothetical protein